MIGTLLNVLAILTGGVIGLTIGKELSAKTQMRLKVFLGLFVIYVGFSLIWNSLSGSFLSVLKQLGIVMLSLMLGNFTGFLLRIQRGLNRLGRLARETYERSTSSTPNSKFSEGFLTCSLLFCIGPMAILGALQDGLTGNFKILAAKSLMDGLATLAFSKTFGWSVMLSAVPVLAYQGTITLCARLLEPYLAAQDLIDSINATGGFLVLFISLVVLEVRKVELANYLPSLIYAPLLTALFN